jgi:hypothetical protein
MFKIIDSGVLSRDPATGKFIPSITPLSDGSFIAAQQAGEALGSRDHQIEILRSDNGRDWQAPEVIDWDDDPGKWSYHSAQVCEIGDRLMLRASRFWHRDAQGQHEPRKIGERNSGPLISWSDDRGRSWTPATFIEAPLPATEYTHHTMGNVIEFSKQHWMFPVQLNSPKQYYSGPNHHGAAALFTTDGGESFGDFTIVAQDPEGVLEYHDQFGIELDDGRLYTMLWTVDTAGNRDMCNHYVISADQGRTWSAPAPTNLRGQVCAPIRLCDGRVAAVYNYRHEPQGIRLAIAMDLATFDTDHEIAIFGAGAETSLGNLEDDHFLTKNFHIAFGRPNGVALADGGLLAWFWCTIDEVTHTRWVRVAAENAVA